MSEEALYLDAALTVEKLYSGREERSIRKYLNKCIHDYEELKLKDELTRDRIHGHVDALDEHGDVFDTLQTMRDEWLAHHDSEAFDDPHAFMQEYSVSLDELGELVHTGQSILEEHYLAHGVYFSPGLSRESDLLGLIDILVRYKEAHDMRYKHNSSKDDIMKKIFHKDESRIEELRDKFDDFRQ